MNNRKIAARAVTILMFCFLLVFSCKAHYGPVETIKLPRTGQLKSYHPGDDGDLRKGVKWPNPRFVNNHNGTITDRLTGLMWEAAPSKKTVNWYDAFKRIKEVNRKKLGGYSDWHLPNVRELESLSNYRCKRLKLIKWLNIHGFEIIDYSTLDFWSSTASSEETVYTLQMFEGSIGFGNRRAAVNILSASTIIKFYAIAVRRAGKGLIKIPKTGQTKSYHKGDDGELQLGVSLPHPRFISNDNGTMTDRLTGLMWEKAPSKKKFKWKDAFKRIEEINRKKLGGYSDWRLPNIKELLSLASYSRKFYKLLRDEGFRNIDSRYWSFWSSTTKDGVFPTEPYVGLVWCFHISDISITTIQKDSKVTVIAVRGPTW